MTVVFFYIPPFFFFFNDTATTEIYTLSLHDALPISHCACTAVAVQSMAATAAARRRFFMIDRKSTRLNSSHTVISYAVFCLKKKINDPSFSRLGLASNITSANWHVLLNKIS